VVSFLIMTKNASLIPPNSDKHAMCVFGKMDQMNSTITLNHPNPGSEI